MIYFDHMMPDGSHKRIRSVEIHHYSGYISRFSFFDTDGALIWEIGWDVPNMDVKAVELKENEVIVGVVAKLYSEEQSRFTDFQFQIARLDVA